MEGGYLDQRLDIILAPAYTFINRMISFIYMMKTDNARIIFM